MNHFASFLARLVTMTLAIIITDWILPGIRIEGVPEAVFLSLVLSILNVVVKPLLILLTLPFTLISFGIFLFVINATIVLFADWLVPGFEADGFWWSLAFSVLLSLTSSVLEAIGIRGASTGKRE